MLDFMVSKEKDWILEDSQDEKKLDLKLGPPGDEEETSVLSLRYVPKHLNPLKEFTEFGGAIHQRPVEDLAFAVARFIQKGGSFVNYYMYHGGNNFGRTAGVPFITNSYDYDAPFDEYGLIREPKYRHMKELHRAIKLCEKALVSADPVVTSLGSYQEAHVFQSQSECTPFLSNYKTDTFARITFNNVHYNLPPWSINILSDCRNVVFNTAKVGVQTSHIQMSTVNAESLMWERYDEEVASLADNSHFTSDGLLEQINVTRDASDYLWYITSVDISPNERFLHGGQLPSLTVESAGQALHVFINGELLGSAYGIRENRKITYTGSANLRAESNKIALLSVVVGLPNVGVHYELWSTGVLGPVVIHGIDQGKRDLTWQKWLYQVGLKGESMNLHSPEATSSVEWMLSSLAAQNQESMTWYRAYFDAPAGDDPLALDLSSMGKGQIYINGQHIRRY